METAFLAVIAIVLGAGAAGGLVTTWALHRRTLRLEYRVTDLEERSLTVRNREKADKRWEKQRQHEDELEQVLFAANAPRAQKVRYANEPIEPGF